METFMKLFEKLLVFVYHCFDRIVIQGHLPTCRCWRGKDTSCSGFVRCRACIHLRSRR